MGAEPIIFIAPVGALFMIFLVLAVAAERKRIYPTAALIVSILFATYLALEGQKSHVIWFFFGFALASPPASLVAYTIRGLVWYFGEPRGT